jgi:hypothetical protein
VDLPDQARQPLPPQLTWTGGSAFVLVVALPGDAQDPAAPIDRCPGFDESVDHRVEPFGRGLSSSRNFAAARVIASSVGGLLLLLAGPDQGNGPGAELGRVGTWHGAEPFGKAAS